MTQALRDHALQEGWEAHRRGRTPEDNPYMTNQIQYRFWLDGWQTRERSLDRAE